MRLKGDPSLDVAVRKRGAAAAGIRLRLSPGSVRTAFPRTGIPLTHGVFVVSHHVLTGARANDYSGELLRVITGRHPRHPDGVKHCEIAGDPLAAGRSPDRSGDSLGLIRRTTNGLRNP